MPDPNKKISLILDERNVICTAKETGKEATASATPKPKKTSAKESKEGSATKSKKKSKTAKEQPSVLNEEPCPPGPTCQIARPDIADPKARVNKTKPGCIDFEKCDDVEEEEEHGATNTGCPNFEDCKDLEREENKLKEQNKKQMKKEEVKKVTDAKPCPKKDAS